MAPEPTNRAAIRQPALGSPTFRVEFDVRPAFDFLVSLAIGEGDDADILPEDRKWLVDARRSLTPAQQQDLLAAFGDESHKGLGIHVAELLGRQRDIRTAADVVAAVGAIDPQEFVRLTVDEVLSYEGMAEHMDAAVAGDETALVAIEAGLREEVCAPVMHILRDPAGELQRLESVLGAWLEHYRDIESRVLRMLERDAGRQSGRGEGQEATDLVEQATGGIRLVGDRSIRVVYLAPGYFNRPYNYVFGADDGRLVVYPIAEESIESAEGHAPPPAVVRLYRALGDETRLRILRLLRERDRYLTEIATEIELSKPTVKHHLSMLRAAGLVTMTEEGSLTYYSLRRQRLAEGGAELERYLA